MSFWELVAPAILDNELKTLVQAPIQKESELGPESTSIFERIIDIVGVTQVCLNEVEFEATKMVGR